ncbi:MAG: efflux RND transporter periplasmic adaptor subunit [candidate division KSB1 bacterium]|nr:efflux RND transporter periplasmic adaptor subunit [candidate division KSB1 bacterium]MDZ7302339.1 efflux RND transporter periplasmic adaptor subunit [candidate division KSB1 bacterium]MDZ7311192.1 efflux RND transporter periplasmic adaptor subunit [candidate division KSB1 bacterium]
MRSLLEFFLLSLLLVTGCSKKNNSTFQASAILEGTAIKVAAQTGGYLLQVNFDEGEDVQIGQTVAVVDTEKLGYQLEQVRANLQELAVQHRIAETNVRRAQDDHAYAKIKYERYLDLFQKNAASQQVLDDLKIGYDRAKTALESAQQTLASIASREKGLEAQAKLLRRQINDALVKAPVSGTITTRYYDAGETIPPNAPLVEIIDLSKMWAKVYVSETYLPLIKIGQPAHIKVDGISQTFTGVVAWISAKAEFTPKNILTQESRTALVYAVKITVDNPDKILKHGMPVSVTLTPTS